MRDHRQKTVVWVVWRWDDWPEITDREALDGQEILPTHEEADAEAARLNDFVADRKHTRYFVQPGRFYPEGRKVNKGY